MIHYCQKRPANQALQQTAAAWSVPGTSQLTGRRPLLSLGVRPPEAGFVVDPFELDWGVATPEFVNGDRRLALHVANHDLADPANLRRTARFLAARARWFARHLPAGWRQRVVIDDRGQSPAPAAREALRDALTGLAEVSFLSEGGGGV